jgi:serine/threonine protein kinase
VLYELLAGQTPFESDKTYELIDMVKQAIPPRPRDVSKYPVPKLLESLCMQCLQKDAAARPASMDEFLRVLQEDWASELAARKRS